MKYNLFITDFDGTLLRSDRTASERTIRAIKAYREAGGTFIISTGRMYESIVSCAHLVGLGGIDMPISAMDGGIIKTVSGKTIALHTMPWEQTAALARECEEMGLCFQVYSEDTLFVAEETDFNRGYCRVSRIGMKPVGRLSDYITANKLACVKILIADDNAESFISRFEGKYSGIRFFMSLRNFLDGASISAGKGNALKCLASYLGVPIERTIAVGDSMNDLSMIEAAGLGVAVANADKRLLSAAKLVAPSNDNDGVASLLESAIEDSL